MRIAIGFTGVKQSGKSTSYAFLKEVFTTIQEIAFADLLKKACSTVFDIPRGEFDDPAIKEVEFDLPITIETKHVTDLIEFFGEKADFDKHVRQHIGKVLYSRRHIAQYVGTEILRNVRMDIHCVGATNSLPERGIFVFTDMRFMNEFEHLRTVFGKDFYPFFITRNVAEFNSKSDQHASEKYVFEIAKNCIQIDNNGSLADLQREVLLKVGPIFELNGAFFNVKGGVQ